MSESVRETLQAALDAGRGDGGGAPAEAAAPVEAAAAPVVEATSEAPTAEPAASPDRDEHGRFKPKTDTPAAEGAQAAAPPAAPNTETAKPADEGSQTETTRIPPSLPAAVKAQWSELKPEVQQAFHKLEETVQTSKAEWGRKGERLNRYDEIIGPHVDRWRVGGLDEFSAIQTLIAAQNVLERSPVDGLVHIARSYGITAQHLAQALGLPQQSHQMGAEGQPTPTGAPDLAAMLQPALAPVLERFQTLEQRLNQQAQASEAAEFAQVKAQVDSFAADPGNRYFENVRQDVARRIESKAASTLAEAYEQAIWASPEIRPLLLAEQTKQAQAANANKTAEEIARTKASQAKAASGSVTGSPTPGAQPLNAGAPLPLRDELKANLRAASASV